MEDKSEQETMALSTVKVKSYNSMVSWNDLKIKGCIWKTKPSLSNSTLPDFQWQLKLKEDHEDNRNLYMSYLRETLTWPEGHVLVDCNLPGHGYANLLSTQKFDTKHSSKGNIDVVVAETADAENQAIKQNIKAGIDLKKNINHGEHERQVVVQHLVSSSLNPRVGVLTIMTDLQERWRFYWFAAFGKQLYKLNTTGPFAAFLLEHMFDDPRTSDVSPFLPVDFLNRGTWNTFNQPTLAGIAEIPSFENGGVGGVSDRDGNGGGGPKDSGEDAGEDGGETESKNVVVTSKLGNNCSTEGANLLDHLEFADEDERREIILGYLADNVVPRMVASPEEETLTKPNFVACPRSLF
eukprot:scaffold35145_cov39-Attheya_sp.AAC.1